MTKDMVPQGYTVGLALFDSVPVILFGLAAWLLWRMTGSILLLCGGIICTVSGLLKVLWKFVVVLCQKNIWPLFVQMRIGMPAGMTVMLAGFIVACFAKDMSAFRMSFFQPASVLFFLLSVLGIMAMIRCGSKLDAADPKANWIEQTCNTIAQGAFFLSMLLVYLRMT